MVEQSGKADIHAEKLKTDETGFSAKINYAPKGARRALKGVSQFYNIDIPRLSGEALINVSAHFPVAGKFHIDAMLPALLCGELFGISIEDGVTALQTFTLPPGRMSIIEGIKGATILDSSYNASPEAVKEALELLKRISRQTKNCRHWEYE